MRGAFWDFWADEEGWRDSLFLQETPLLCQRDAFAVRFPELEGVTRGIEAFPL